jgi:glucose 1-dehydrogenase
MRLENKVAIVTGAAQGIGLACATRLASDGARVVIADINEEEGEKAAAELTEAGHAVSFVECNVGERLDIRNLVTGTVSRHDRIDILVNNAAVIDSAPILELEEEELDRVLKVNLKGPFLLSQAVARQMVKQVEEGGAPGSIINMSSVNAVFALPDHAAYSIAKGGLAQLTKALALALAPTGIRVNAIGPGSIMTPMLEKVATDKAIANRILSRTPMGRFGHPAEIAAIAAFLASDDASYVTGATIYADGGRLPLNYTVEVTEEE